MVLAPHERTWSVVEADHPLIFGFAKMRSKDFLRRKPLKIFDHAKNMAITIDVIFLQNQFSTISKLPSHCPIRLPLLD
jgi:hypothetical protein